MKIIYLFKRIKLKNQYNNNVEEVNEVLQRIKVLEHNYNYVDDNMQTYYDYELILLKQKYKKMLNKVKEIDKNIENI